MKLPALSMSLKLSEIVIDYLHQNCTMHDGKKKKQVYETWFLSLMRLQLDIYISV